MGKRVCLYNSADSWMIVPNIKQNHYTVHGLQERHALHLLRQGHQPGGQPQQRACPSQDQQPALQAGPQDGPQEAASVQRLPDHGEGRELAEEEPHPRAFQRHGLLRRRRQRLHRQRLPLLGGAAGGLHLVCRRRGLQVGAQERVERQELLVVGAVALQQQLCRAAQRQGDAGGGQPAAAAARRAAGLRQQRAGLLRRHELPAPAHLRHLLPAARGAHLHHLEQVGDDPVGAARARLSPAAAAPADGALSAGVAVRHRDESLPL
ncbi:unnamed protein product, partial [Lota lota]